MVKLIASFYDPTEGEVLWDGIDLREGDPIDLRSRIGAILHDFVHYDLTAYENIGLGNLKRMDNSDYVYQAATWAGIHDTIESLPYGYQTILSRWLAEDGKGIDLSGGEWQKIALARMFMRSADLLILDEPTAALDALAEFEIYSRFLDLITGKSCLLISHRFSTIREADIIAVLKNGIIIEHGSHEALIEYNGAYAQLFKKQAERYK